MNSFKYIIQNLFNCEIGYYNEIKINKYKFYNTNEINNILFSYFLNKDDDSIIDIKYKLLNDTLNNIFLSDEIKNEYIDIFCKIQNIYFSIVKFKNVYKYKKYKTLINTDLLLNPLSINNKHCFQLIQNRCKYLFSLNDLINIFDNSLSKSSYLFFVSSPIKNPYNNIDFNNSTLYNIYFFIKSNTIRNVELIDKYFLCNFDLVKYNKEYKFLVREYIIKNHVKNCSNELFREIVDDMLDDFNYIDGKRIKNRICIDKEFPINELRVIMKDYVLLYMISQYSLIEHKKIHACDRLKNKLTKFKNYNSLFGRKYFKINRYYCPISKKFKRNITIHFNNTALNFNDETDKWLYTKNNNNNISRRNISNINTRNNTNIQENNRFFDNLLNNYDENTDIYLWVNDNDNDTHSIIRRRINDTSSDNNTSSSSDEEQNYNTINDSDSDSTESDFNINNNTIDTSDDESLIE